MMSRRDNIQQKMLCVTIESLMPQQHFLRDLDRLMDFSFVYDKVEHLYSSTGRSSIDPVVIIKMMLLGYLYGINSERRLEQEVQVNIAYRWFLGIDLDESVPDHSTFSQLRRRKFNGSTIFEDVFSEVVRRCMELGLIDGKLLLTDSTHIRANVRNNVVEKMKVAVEPTEYIRRLNEEAKKDGIYIEQHKKKTPKFKELSRSPVDPDCGFMNRPGKPIGFHYLSHETCDGKNGIITDVYVTPGNVADCTVHAARIKNQIERYGFDTEAICADSGYDFAEIHHDMLMRGIQTFIPQKPCPYDKDGYFTAEDFKYDPDTDSLVCPQGEILPMKGYCSVNGVKRYRCAKRNCSKCPLHKKCISSSDGYKTIYRTYHKQSVEIQHQKDYSPEYFEALRKRQIFCEGNFSHQKARHNLTRVRMWGIGKATEHCLLSACALNLKRMVKLA